VRSFKTSIAKTLELKRVQATEDTPEDRATIPSLGLDDLKKEVTEYPISVSDDENGSGVTVLRHELGSTSGIAYANLLLDVSMVPLDDAPLLKLLTRMLTQTGTSKYNSVALSQRIGIFTGGISTSIMTVPVKRKDVDENVITDCDTMITKLVVQGKVTSDRIDEMFSLFLAILTDANLDSQSKVVEMLRESKASIESSIQGSGHSYAHALMESAKELENDPEALATAIIGAVGDMDGALSPDQKGWTAFSRWIINQSPEARQKRRDEILNTKPSDFRDFAERLRKMKNPSTAVVSSKAAFEAAEKEGKSFSLTEVL